MLITGHKGIGNGWEYLDVSCLTMGNQTSGKELELKDGKGIRECKRGKYVNESVRTSWLSSSIWVTAYSLISS